MSLLAQRRAYLAAYRKSGSHAEAAKAMDLPIGTHEAWMSDWLYRSAFTAVQKEMAEANTPPPNVAKGTGSVIPAPKRPPGRPRKALPAPKVAKRIGRPPKAKGGDAPCPNSTTICDAARSVDSGRAVESPPEAPASPQDAPQPPDAPEPAPPLVGTTFPGDRGYVRLFAPEGAEVEPPPEPEKPKREAQEPSAEPVIDVSIATDEQQKSLLDELGELDRKFKLRSLDLQRFESLKKAVRLWFDGLPSDCDGVAEGNVFLVHLSARENERRIRDIRELVQEIGLDAVLDMAVIPLSKLEHLIGKTRLDSFTTETRSGSRRIKCIPKYPAALPPA